MSNTHQARQQINQALLGAYTNTTAPPKRNGKHVVSCFPASEIVAFEWSRRLKQFRTVKYGGPPTCMRPGWNIDDEPDSHKPADFYRVAYTGSEGHMLCLFACVKCEALVWAICTHPPLKEVPYQPLVQMAAAGEILYPLVTTLIERTEA